MSLAFVAGQVLTADALNATLPLKVVKAITEPLTNSTVLQNDDELFLDLAAGRTYQVTCSLSVAGAAAADIKVAWSTTGTIAIVGGRECLGPHIATTDITATLMRTSRNGLTTAVPYGVDGVASGGILETFTVVCTAAGRLQLQWAQNTTNATATNVNTTSWIVANPID